MYDSEVINRTPNVIMKAQSDVLSVKHAQKLCFDISNLNNYLCHHQSGAPLAWDRWVPWNPSIFREGFSNPSIFWAIQ